MITQNSTFKVTKRENAIFHIFLSSSLYIEKSTKFMNIKYDSLKLCKIKKKRVRIFSATISVAFPLRNCGT